MCIASFVSIFGDRKTEGMPHIANVILVDYANTFPPDTDGKIGKHSRVRRGVVTLGQYLHSEGVKRSGKESSRRLKLDLEAFVVKTEAVRKWDAARSRGEWDVLRKNPKNYADDRGPPPTRFG